jgi:flagellin
MRINNNMAAMNAWRNLSTSGANLSKSLERLSSGYRINKAADDAAGLAVSEKMKAQIRGTNMATRNTQDAVSMVQTAEGGASKVQDMLQRMRELAVQASSDTLENSDRSKLQEEFSSLKDEIDRTAKAAQFNGRSLLDGSSGSKVTVTSGTSLTAQVTDLKGLTADTTIVANVFQKATQEITTGGAADLDGGTPVSLTNATKLSEVGFAVGDSLKLSQKASSDAASATDVTLVVTDANQTVSSFLSDLNAQMASKGLSARASVNADGVVEIASNVDGSWGNVTATETAAAGGATLGLTAATTSGGTDAQFVGGNISIDGAATAISSLPLTVVGNTITGDAGGAYEGFRMDVADSGTTTLKLTKNELDFQVGANKGESISTSFADLTKTNLGIDTLDITSKTNASDALEDLDTALSNVSSYRANMGAMQNRLDNVISTLQTQSENLTAAESRIRDVDMAAEMSQFTKFQVLQQAGTAMLAQANQLPQGIMSLLR